MLRKYDFFFFFGGIVGYYLCYFNNHTRRTKTGLKTIYINNGNSLLLKYFFVIYFWGTETYKKFFA